MIGQGAIGCLLEWASLPNWKSGRLLMMLREGLARLQRGSVSFIGDLGSGLCFCGLAPVALGAGLNIIIPFYK